MNKEKIKERIAVCLLSIVLLLTGILLLKEDKKESIIFRAGDTAQAKQSSTNIEETEKERTGININKSSAEDLATLPGIGEVLAGRVIDYRKKNGGFKTIEEIKEVSGIGDAKYNGIKDLISL